MMAATDARIPDVVVIGAGISGLVCARELVAGGRTVLVLDKSRGVGGRCATRRMLGQPVDIGLSYFHADDPELLAELASVPAKLLPGWPQRIAGDGAPCHPAAFRAGQQRLAYAEGVNVFPRQLARGLDMQLGARVTRLTPRGGRVELELEDGPPVYAHDVVLTIPAPQAAAVLPIEEGRALRAVDTLLTRVEVQPCITLALGYPIDLAPPDFDILYPESSSELQLIAHDSSKRERPDYHVLVVQARSAWSAEHLELGKYHWLPALTEAAARLLGDWVRRPAWADVHRWRFAKTTLSTELGAPLVFGLAGGGRLGLTSEAFAVEAGVQGAWRAGRGLARRLLADRTQRDE